MRRIILHFNQAKKLRSNLTTLMFFIFFFMVADAILAYWLPGYLESTLGPAWMGIIIGSSSVFGILTDLLFPQISNHISIKKLLITANVFYLFYAIIVVLLVRSSGSANTWLWLIPMGIWGIYYELISFANQQFVSEKIPAKNHQDTWVKIDFAKRLAYLFGPIIVGYLAIKNDPYLILFIAIGFSILAILPVIKLWKKMTLKEKLLKALGEKMYFPRHGLEELNNWKNFALQAWPLVSIHLTTILAEAIFWSGIAALSFQISKTSPLGWLIFPTYMVPTVLVPLILNHQANTIKTLKKMSIVSILIGLTFFMFSLTNNPKTYLALSFFLGLFVASIIPMSESLFTRFAAKLKRKQRHIISFQGSLFSLPYIVGPITYGLVSQAFNHQTAFAVIGTIILFIALIVLFKGIKDIKIKSKSILDWRN